MSLRRFSASLCECFLSSGSWGVVGSESESGELSLWDSGLGFSCSCSGSRCCVICMIWLGVNGDCVILIDAGAMKFCVEEEEEEEVCIGNKTGENSPELD